ncbi:hypothetical protein FNF31_01310 [Cafeteria roenbergensis]|uniref:Uncharacterized protein n=2 Tax=Cafeteria roenbergensis TaxID=33653 RepID=A0A5A8DMC9_CAFRO|nr:hypothetical protein FNF31_01310 [Cafeteria roenbergensis]
MSQPVSGPPGPVRWRRADAEAAFCTAPVGLLEQAAAIVVDDVEPAEMTALLGAMARLTQSCSSASQPGGATEVACDVLMLETDLETRAPVGERLHVALAREAKGVRVAAVSAGPVPGAQVRLRLAQTLGWDAARATEPLHALVAKSSLERRRFGGRSSDIRSSVLDPRISVSMDDPASCCAALASWAKMHESKRSAMPKPAARTSGSSLSRALADDGLLGQVLLAESTTVLNAARRVVHAARESPESCSELLRAAVGAALTVARRAPALASCSGLWVIPRSKRSGSAASSAADGLAQGSLAAFVDDATPAVFRRVLVPLWLDKFPDKDARRRGTGGDDDSDASSQAGSENDRSLPSLPAAARHAATESASAAARMAELARAESAFSPSVPPHAGWCEDAAPLVAVLRLSRGSSGAASTSNYPLAAPGSSRVARSKLSSSRAGRAVAEGDDEGVWGGKSGSAVSLLAPSQAPPDRDVMAGASGGGDVTARPSSALAAMSDVSSIDGETSPRHLTGSARLPAVVGAPSAHAGGLPDVAHGTFPAAGGELSPRRAGHSSTASVGAGGSARPRVPALSSVPLAAGTEASEHSHRDRRLTDAAESTGGASAPVYVVEAVVTPAIARVLARLAGALPRLPWLLGSALSFAGARFRGVLVFENRSGRIWPAEHWRAVLGGRSRPEVERALDMSERGGLYCAASSLTLGDGVRLEEVPSPVEVEFTVRRNPVFAFKRLQQDGSRDDERPAGTASGSAGGDAAGAGEAAGSGSASPSSGRMTIALAVAGRAKGGASSRDSTTGSVASNAGDGTPAAGSSSRFRRRKRRKPKQVDEFLAFRVTLIGGAPITPDAAIAAMPGGALAAASGDSSPLASSVSPMARAADAGSGLGR